jgi:hypothetical protein
LPSSFVGLRAEALRRASVVAEVHKTFGPSSDKNFTAGAAQGFILLRILGALHLDIFDQPYKSCLFSNLLDLQENNYSLTFSNRKTGSTTPTSSR